MVGVVSTHRCEDLTDGAEILLDRLLLNGIPLRRHKSGMDTLRENLEEQNGVFNAFEVGGDLQPDIEAPLLAPGGGVFIEDVGR